MRWVQQELPSLDWIPFFQPPVTSTKTVGQTHARGPSHTLGTEQALGSPRDQQSLPQGDTAASGTHSHCDHSGSPRKPQNYCHREAVGAK